MITTKEIWIVWGVALLLAPAAWAVDPACDIPTPPEPTSLDIRDGTLDFCTARADVDGDPIPETGWEQTCFLLVDGQETQVVANARPGQHITATVVGFKYDYERTNLVCENKEGRGRKLAASDIPGSFPGAAVDSPFLPL